MTDTCIQHVQYAIHRPYQHIPSNITTTANNWARTFSVKCTLLIRIWQIILTVSIQSCRLLLLWL